MQWRKLSNQKIYMCLYNESDKSVNRGSFTKVTFGWQKNRKKV